MKGRKKELKQFKTLVALVLAAMMIVGMMSMALAQTVGTASSGTGSITIKNASKGEKYGVVKLFDATVGANGAINYTGTIPAELSEYFTADTAGNISKAAGKTDEQIVAAVQVWAAKQTFSETESDGTALTFAGLSYGYYVVKSSQGTVITVDSTNPNADIYDKNSKEITVEKKVGKESYSIGDTITYTATFDTVNYIGAGENAKQVINYEIQDTLPEFLTDVTVTGITVGGTAIATQQFTNKKINIPWATEVTGSNPKTYTSLYANGAKLVITYTAKLTSVTNINTADTNTVSLHPTTWNGTTEEKPWDDKWQDDAVIKTYAVALKKTDGTNPLPGAQFTITGLTVSGSAGEYTVVSYDPDSTAQSAVLDTDANGKLYILGLASDVKLTVTEYKQPDGYNKLTDPITDVAPQLLTTKIYKASGTIKYDAKGNVIASEATATTTETVTKNLTDLDAKAVEVKNTKGTELPSTGGIGTTIFYIAGIVMVLGAAAVIIARRKAEQN